MLYIAYSGPMQTTAAFTETTTGTAIKTLLQVATPSSQGIQVRAWGISFNGSAAATPIRCELIDTNVAATVTAHVAAGVQQYDPESIGSGRPSVMTLGTSATGYAASAEGSITATRFGDLQYVAPSGGYMREWSLGKEFQVAPSRFLRVRVHAGAAVNAVAWIMWEE